MVMKGVSLTRKNIIYPSVVTSWWRDCDVIQSIMNLMVPKKYYIVVRGT